MLTETKFLLLDANSIAQDSMLTVTKFLLSDANTITIAADKDAVAKVNIAHLGATAAVIATTTTVDLVSSSQNTMLTATKFLLLDANLVNSR